jgi:hypothetical protein
MANVYCKNGWYFSEANGWTYASAELGPPALTVFDNATPANLGTTGITATLDATDNPAHAGLNTQRDAWITAAKNELAAANRVVTVIGDCYGELTIVAGKLLTSRTQCKASAIRTYIPNPILNNAIAINVAQSKAAASGSDADIQAAVASLIDTVQAARQTFEACLSYSGQ